MGTKDGGKKPDPNNLNTFKGFFYYMIVILVMTVLLNGIVFPSALKQQVKEVGYNEFLTMVDNGDRICHKGQQRKRADLQDWSLGRPGSYAASVQQGSYL